MTYFEGVRETADASMYKSQIADVQRVDCDSFTCTQITEALGSDGGFVWHSCASILVINPLLVHRFFVFFLHQHIRNADEIESLMASRVSDPALKLKLNDFDGESSRRSGQIGRG